LIGVWTRWCLGNRDPWLWVIFWLLEGKAKWVRPALLVYWASVCSISVAGWNRQLARSRKYRSRNSGISSGDNVPESTSTLQPSTFPSNSANISSPASPGALSLTFSSLPNGANVSNVATDLLDAADKHVPTLRLNARRKFFHALAVIMFLPGVAFDVSLPPDLDDH
jgi:dolichol kinase